MNLIEQETPLAPPFPELPHWSENFCLAGHDPASGIGFWLHLGRWRKDLTLWRETVVINLPDGTVLAHKAYGNALTADDGPGGPCYSIRVVRSGHELRYRFDGAVRRVAAASLRSGLLADGPKDRLSFELKFDSNADIWDLPKVGNRQRFLGTGHVEQIGRVRGTIRAGSDTFAFDGRGNRDHSMGPRDTPSLRSHQWLQGYFENGISFLVYDAMLRGHDTPVFCEAAVYEETGSTTAGSSTHGASTRWTMRPETTASRSDTKKACSISARRGSPRRPTCPSPLRTTYI